jgi:hypothetical protein
VEESREQVETRPITVYEIMCDPAFAAGQRCTERPPVQLRLLIGGPLGLRARTPMGLSRANAHAPQDPRQAKPQGAYALLSRVRQKVHHMSKKQKNSSRSLTTIVREIRGTFRNDIANIIRRGNLLQEAKDQLPHGEWLPWLQDNFEMDERTAQRAMAAAKFAATKSANVSDLNLTKSALYELSSNEYPPKVVRAALKGG